MIDNLDYNETQEEYPILIKSMSDIIDDIDFSSEEDKLICESIISNMEKDIADGIRDMKTVQIPFIGCIRIDPVKRKLRDSKLKLSDVRKNTNKEEYKNYVRSLVNDFKNEQKVIDANKTYLNKIRQHNSKTYEKYYKTLGREYAELYIASIAMLKEVPFDEEWEKQYQIIKNL